MMVRLGLPISPGVMPLEMSIAADGCNQRRDFEMQTAVKLSGGDLLARTARQRVCGWDGRCVELLTRLLDLCCRELFLCLLPPACHRVGPTVGVGIRPALPGQRPADSGPPTLPLAVCREEEARVPRPSCENTKPV